MASTKIPAFTQLLLVLLAVRRNAQPGAECPELLRHASPRLQDDVPQNPKCQYTGKVLLVVNTASYCGFTGCK